MSFELNLSRQSAADREALAALSSRCDEQDEELQKLREELPGLKEKLAKCSELKERSVRTKQWRDRARKQLEETVGSLDAVSNKSATLGHEVSHLMDIHAKLVHENQCLLKQVSADSAKFKTLLSG